jgi:preprotein translocase subunit SecE
MEGVKVRNPLLALTRYLREAKEELGKVAWPTREEAFRYSTLVIGISLAVAVFLGVLDWGLTIGLEKLIEISQS